MNFQKLFEWIGDNEVRAKESFKLLQSCQAIREIDSALATMSTICRVSIENNKLSILQGEEFFILPKLFLTRDATPDFGFSQIILQTEMFHLRYHDCETVELFSRPTQSFLEIKNSRQETIFFQGNASTESIFLPKESYVIRNPSGCITLEIC